MKEKADMLGWKADYTTVSKLLKDSLKTLGVAKQYLVAKGL